ncbi:vitamin B12 transporter [Marinomonas communis]|uniref:Vitamin B12 transporter n=2 Tax=Marinomonas communis TaxID=28254 RepID=A0A4R6XBJ0_9GAMM|nr:vitamin B12 transporter [Marinomonas communis]
MVRRQCSWRMMNDRAGVLDLYIEDIMNTTISLPKTFIALGLLAHQSSSIAQSDSSTELNTLSQLVVTATTTEQTTAKSLTSVTVIDKKTLQAQQPQELSEVLAGQPGIDIVSNGGYGKSTSVLTRGANSTGTKLLIDGVPIQSHSLGTPSWQYIPISQVERVEIVRGPKSSLYGSSASGGVIQVFLPEGNAETAADVSVGAGSFGTRQVDTSVSGQEGSASYVISAGTFRTDGTPVKSENKSMPYTNDHFMARFGYEFDNDAYIKMLVMRAAGESDYESYGNLRSNDYMNQVMALTAGIDVSESWQSELQLREARDEYDVLDSDGNATGTFYNSRSQALRWSNTVWLDNHEFVVGAERIEDDFEGSYSKDRQSNSIFAQSLSQFGQASVQLNVRADHYSEYDTQTTGGVALGYQLEDHYTLRLSGRSSFTAPTFNSMNAENWGYTLTNEIRPETSQTIEAGIRADFANMYWDAAIYQADYQDLISWTYPTVGNIDAARAQGLELSSGVTVEQWSLAASATFMETENRSSGSEYGKQLARRAKQSARIELDRHFEKGLLGATLVGYGQRYDDAANSTVLPGFGLLHLRAQYDLAEHWKASVQVKNALDKSYQTADGYRNPGRGIFLSVQYSAF